MEKNIELLTKELSQVYDFGGEIISVNAHGEGHINTTYCVEIKSENGLKRFILQKINVNIFKDPVGLMENIWNVTSFLKEKIIKNCGDPERETLNIIKTKNGETFYKDMQGSYWRVYTFVENTVCLQNVEKEDDFYTVAQSFGEFQKLLADYPANTLHETIKDFHDTPSRFEAFKKVLQEDKMGRASSVKDEINFVLSHEKDCHVLKDLLDQGKIPLKVTHNDTKLNNVLIDEKTGKGICIIDLDTVMPGLALHDYGDSIRFGANHCEEDEKDLSKVNFSLHLFEVFTKGFMTTAGDALTQTEKEYLPWGAKLMTLECGIRFLTDHLDGDNYFKIHRKNHNLDRCRTQFKLVSDMEKQWDEMENIVKKYS